MRVGALLVAAVFLGSASSSEAELSQWVEEALNATLTLKNETAF